MLPTKTLLHTKELFSLSHTLALPLLKDCTFPWQALKPLADFITKLGESLDEELYQRTENNVWISKSAEIFPGAYIAGPTIIGHNTQVRPGAFIRGSVLVGEGCVVGNSTELKNSILFDGVQVPHYNYIGDSILGYKAHTGAGAITSNVKQDKTPITIFCEDEKINTGLKKFGAMLGDFAEIGCNAVMNPGTVVGKNSRIYPLSMVRGFVPPNSIYKKQGEIAQIN